MSKIFSALRPVRSVQSILLSASLFVFATGCAITQNPFDRAVAGRTLPGHFQVNQCEKYSIHLTTALIKRGVPAYRLGYEWRTPSGRTGLHAVVLFREGGRTFMMDNVRFRPVEITATTDLGACQQFEPLAVRVQNVSTDEFYTAPRRLDDLLKADGFIGPRGM